MNDGYLWWLILVGAVITLAVVWVVAARLPRSEADVGAEERSAEAAWISQTIERFGGVAPAELVEEVLELHAEYLASPRLARIPDRAERAVASDVVGPVTSAASPPVTGQPEQPPPGSPTTFAARTVSGPPLPVGAPPPPLGPADRPPPRPR